MAIGRGHSGSIARLRISPDGQKVISVGAEGGIFIWSLPKVQNRSGSLSLLPPGRCWLLACQFYQFKCTGTAYRDRVYSQTLIGHKVPHPRKKRNDVGLQTVCISCVILLYQFVFCILICVVICILITNNIPFIRYSDVLYCSDGLKEESNHMIEMSVSACPSTRGTSALTAKAPALLNQVVLSFWSWSCWKIELCLAQVIIQLD